ncbi:MAG: 50S ribosomal protein L5 [Candidatus Hodarchaeales archaeon]|jgi:large subunit ribosomal protein L5
MRRRPKKPDLDEEREPVPLTETEQAFVKEWKTQPMRKPRVLKVSVNFAVGASGPKLEKARELCERITNQAPADGKAKESVRGFAIRKHEPIGVFTTLRGELAHEFLKKALWAIEDKISSNKFDEFGNLSFGLDDHLKLPNIKYDPKIGVHGFNTTVVLERPGYRTKRRRIRPNKIPTRHKITKEEGITFFKHEYNLGVE